MRHTPLGKAIIVLFCVAIVAVAQYAAPFLVMRLVVAVQDHYDGVHEPTPPHQEHDPALDELVDRILTTPPREPPARPDVPPTRQEPPAQHIDDGDIDLLAGRLLIHMPQARIEEAPHDVMSAPRPQAEETRVWMRPPGQRMVARFTELFQTGKGDLLQTARRLESMDDRIGTRAHYENLELAGTGLRAVALRWDPAPRSKNGLLIATVYVQSPDGTLQRGDWYVDPVTADARCAAVETSVATSGDPNDRCAQLAMTAMRSLRAGQRPSLVAPAGRQPLDSWCPATIDLPAGWSVHVEVGADFRVYRVLPIDEDHATGTSIGIYAGWAPHGVTPGNLTPIPGTVLGRSNTWEVSSHDLATGSNYYAAQLLELPGNDHVQMHVWVNAPSAQGLVEGIRIANSLRSTEGQL